MPLVRGGDVKRFSKREAFDVSQVGADGDSRRHRPRLRLSRIPIGNWLLQEEPGTTELVGGIFQKELGSM
jgi:hypothetical protein